MLHNIVFIGLTVLLAFSFPLGIEPAFYDPALCALGVAALLILSALSGALAARVGTRSRAASSNSRRALGAVASPPVLARGFVLLWFAALVYGLNWPWCVQYTLKLNGVVVAEKVFTLLPAIVALMAALAGSFVGEPRRALPGFTFTSYLAFQARMFLGFALLPVLCILAAFDALESVPVVSDLLQIYSSLYFAASVALLLGAYSLAPLILRVAFRTRPLEPWLLARTACGLPAGSCLAESPSAVVARLQSLCRRFDMPAVRFLVWETGGARVANAGMVGLLGGFRYVLLSDFLFELLIPEELESVVGHELGHAKNKHLLVYFVAALIFMVLGHFAFGLLASLDAPPTAQFLFSAAFVLSFWKAGLGGLSRVFECQADLDGARAAGSPAYFTSAMEKIAAAGQIDRHTPSWLYRSVSARIAFVWSAFLVPDEDSRFRATLKRIHNRIRQFSALATLGLMWMVATDFNEAAKRRTELERIRIANMHYLDGYEHYRNRDFDKADLELRRSVSLIPQWAPFKILLADTMRELGLVREAWQTWQSAARDEPPHPIHRIALREVKEALLATGPGAF